VSAGIVCAVAGADLQPVDSDESEAELDPWDSPTPAGALGCSSRWTTQGRFDGKYFRTRPVAELGPCDSGGFKKFTFTRSDILAEHALLAGMPGSFDSGGVRP
jgi:hypothetical protein